MSRDASADDGAPRYAQVVVEVEPYHLDRSFDYRVPDDAEHPVQVGSRVEVVFAGRRRRGLVVGLVDSPDVDPGKVRPLRRVFGPHAWVDPADIEILRWAATRFGGTVADVVRHALPDRVVDVERRAEAAGWFPPGRAGPPSAPPPPASDQLDEAWRPYGVGGASLRAVAADGAGSWFWRPVPGEDVGARLSELVRLCLAGGRDVLVVVPDPASPTADAIVEAAGDLVVDLRPDHGKRATYDRWLRARCGEARVVVGERGVALWPLRRLGLAVLLDEANPALKERRSPRHHAREVLLERARRAGGACVLVGYVPSARAWRLMTEQRVTPAIPDRAAERDRAPRVLADTQEGVVRTRIGRPGMSSLRRAVDAGEYGVVLAARRGEGRALVCRACGWRLRCPVCAGSLSPGRDGLACVACGWSGPRTDCPECGEREFVPLAAGTRRIAEELRRSFDVEVAVLEGYAAEAPPAPAVLVMTRGSVLDAPPGPVGAVVLPDLDGQLRRPTLDAAEDALRLSMQVASWVARPATSGDEPDGVRRPHPVVVQTREPTHHAVQALVRWDPGGFWRAEHEQRRELGFPPARHAIRVTTSEQALDLAAVVPPHDEVLGPVPAEGSWRFLIKSVDRQASLASLDEPRRRWSKDGVDVRVDVDPVDAL
ncbi:MAG: hypothetical protein R3343_03510 [Nitriliruptorales bacterium]|nr:hypothetical protein [Nitriliruptorales bacterium]